MFNKTSLLSVSVTLPPRQSLHSDNLILSGLNISLIDDHLYSEIQELNLFAINCNDYGFGKMNIELCCEPISESYCEMWANCISIRTDTLPYPIKIDTKNLCKANSINMPCYTKITSEGKMSIGISYYFRTLEERNNIRDSNSFLIEGFLALSKRNNVYGFMCTTEKTKNGIWILSEGSTIKPYRKTPIQMLLH